MFNHQCIHLDDDLIIINKPSGLLSIPDGYDPALPYLKTVLEPIYGKLWLVHRLDKPTSGVMILARNEVSHRKLNERFRERKIKKQYHCLVVPKPVWRELHIQLPLRTNADRKHRTRVDHEMGKQAESICQVKRSSQTGALLEIRIFTGITHQIRAHLRAHDIVILGDQLYSAGLSIQQIPVQRLMLHSRLIGFDHPSTGDWMEFSAPYPDDFRAAFTSMITSTFPDAAI